MNPHRGNTSMQSDKDFVTAFTVLQEKRDEHRLTTGNADLDSLLGGGIQPGAFYLFYGDRESGVDLILHQVLVNTLRPIDKQGFEGEALYLNCGNYREEKTVLDVHRLTTLLKASELDPFTALDRIKVFFAFSDEHEEQVVENVVEAIKRDKDVKTLVVHNVAKLFDRQDSKGAVFERLERIKRLQNIVSKLCQACSRNHVALIASCRPRPCGGGRVPKPEGGKYLHHAANILVHLRKPEPSSPSIQALLVKHPSNPPRRISFTFSLGGFDMGRVTIPFRTRFREELGNLKRDYREALRDHERREALDALVRVWSGEMGAMSRAKIPTVLDVMLLTATVDNRRAIEDLGKGFMLLRTDVEKLREELEKPAVPARLQVQP